MVADSFEWQDRAKCKNAPPEYFQQDEQVKHFEGSKVHQKYCQGCPVIRECLDFALIYNLTGVWGGLTERERNKNYNKNRRSWLIDDVKESGYFNNRLDNT